MSRHNRTRVALSAAIAVIALLAGGAGSRAGATAAPPGGNAVPAAAMTAAARAPASVTAADPPPNCRYGAAVTSGLDLAVWLAPMGAGWYADFSAHPPSGLTTAQYAQIIRGDQNRDGCNYLPGYRTTPALTEAALGQTVAAHPGALWIVLNEPDRGPNPGDCYGPGQDDAMPEVYAQIYHDVYHFIKARDPSARVANAGLVQVTPGRLQYLDKVWQAYVAAYGAPMPVDVWNMHLYILPEALPNGQPNGIANVALGTDPALAIRESGGDPARCSDPKVYCYAEHDDMTIFAEQVVAMRTWMKAHGQQNKPLILSEYSLLYPYEIDPGGPGEPPTCYLQDEFGNCFTPDRVSTFMQRSFDYLESAADPNLGYPADGYRLVQRWMWFGTYTNGTGKVSNLVTNDRSALSPLGLQFRNTVIARGVSVNLWPVPPDTLYVPAVGGQGTAPLAVSVLNNGTAPTDAPFMVSFYADSALTQPLGSAVVTAGLDGCGQGTARATLLWPGLTPGPHPYWVRVDSGNALAEGNEDDNVTEGLVIVSPRATFLPLIRRR